MTSASPSVVEEEDLDLALLLTIEAHLETTATRTSDDQEERDLDLVPEMDLLTVDTGTEITVTDMIEDP